MAGSPFTKGAASTIAPPASKAAPAAKDAGLPGADAIADVGDSKPISKGDPFSQAADPTGISGYKPTAFMGQMILMHPTETGTMKTSSNTPENPVSEYVRFDIIPLTVPEPSGTPTRNPAVLDAEGNVAVMNKDGEIETFEAYEVGERLDDVLIFNKPLVREGKKALDNGTVWLRGRIMLGAKKQGQSPPVILQVLSDEDKELYQQIIAQVKQRQR